MNNLQTISTAEVDMNCTLFQSCSLSTLVVVQIYREFTIIIGFCSNSFVSLPHAQALQQDPSAFWRDRIIDCPCCALTVRVDTIWYTVACIKSVNFSASLLESPSRRAIGHFSSTIVINSNAFRCCISMNCNVFTFENPITHICSGCCFHVE